MSKSYGQGVPQYLANRIDKQYRTGSEERNLITAFHMWIDFPKGVRPLEFLAHAMFQYQEAFIAKQKQAASTPKIEEGTTP